MVVFWEWVALILLLALIWVPLQRALLKALDGHSERVQSELAEAKELREAAQALLAENQRQLADGGEQARAIVERAREEAKRQTERHQEELEASLRRRTEQAKARIAQEEAQAVQELRAHTARLTIRTTERLLAGQMDGEQAQKLVDQAIGEIGRKLA
jgi:F-type H+-transporting ATPase subunit b